MAARDTATGGILERMVLPALLGGGYRCLTQVDVGARFGGGRHIVDIVAEDGAGQAVLVSVKWQQVSGTAEQKVAFEAMCLAETVLSSDNRYDKAYLVLGGPGWKLRDFYVGGGLARHLRYDNLVNITTLEEFVARANRGRL